MIMVDKRIHTIDNKIGVKWYVGLHGKDYKRYKKTQWYTDSRELSVNK